MRWRRVVVLVGGALVIGATVAVFVAFDRGSHSASDTVRPFLITMTPLWLVAGWAARRLMRPPHDPGRP